MKTAGRPGRTVMWVVILTLVGGAWVSAQMAGAGHGPRHGDGHGQAFQHGMHMGMMMERLDLDEEQRQSVHAILSGHRRQLRPQMEQVQQARRQVAEAVHLAELDEAAIRDGVAGLAAAETELALARAGIYQQIRALLTTPQLEELDAIMAERQERGSPWPPDAEHGGRHRR